MNTEQTTAPSAPKFKIGQEVFFMKFEEAAKGIITGFVRIQGEVDLGNTKHIVPEGETVFSYKTDNYYSMINEGKLFTTKEELIQHLTSKL